MENEMTINNHVKHWYIITFSGCDVGKTLNPFRTFMEVVQCLERGDNVYDFLGGEADSIVRERVFEKCAELYGVDYDVIYDQWLNNITLVEQ
jgi:hypothetical protein